MITLTSLLRSARAAYGEDAEIRYIHPLVYLIITAEAYAGKDEDQRRDQFAKDTNLRLSGSDWSALETMLSLILRTPNEGRDSLDFLDTAMPGEHWLPLLDPTYRATRKAVDAVVPRSVHFYGYKGGQARSTVLAMLAVQLADDGYKVLAVDADIEAPSLHILFDTSATLLGHTVMGLTDPSHQPDPLSAYKPRFGAGRIDLLSCRPSGEDFEMDFAAFALRTTLDVSLIESATRRLLTHIQVMDVPDRYDFVLYDHRSGLSSSVLPMLKAHPGPTVVCLRIDDQSIGAISLIDVLFSHVKDLPGAFVSFSLDPDETRENMLERHENQIAKFLSSLGTAISRGAEAEDQEGMAPEELTRYWISWFHDRAFLSQRLPLQAEIADANRQSLRQLREVLGMSGRKDTTAQSASKPRTSAALAPSGAVDEGYFIEPLEFSRLFEPNTSISYIFGRKGTGKTRLLREMQARGLGEPLLVAADEQLGLRSSSAVFSDLAQRNEQSPENLWWTVLNAALDSESTASDSFVAILTRAATAATNDILPVSAIAEKASRAKRQRVFLIDGVETAFRAGQLPKFIEGLFRFILTVQTEPLFSERIAIRLFLRTDLARNAIQNVEQQTNGRRLDLIWKSQAIFNFVLSRIGQILWFEANFPKAVAEIRLKSERIQVGDLREDEYEPLLLEIFPKRLRRNNLQTLTFLKTYFSDAAGEDESRAVFYPRLFTTFLDLIASPRQLPHGKVPPVPLEDERIHQALVLSAHEHAAKQYLAEVQQELTFLLELGSDTKANEFLVQQLLSAFDGMRTPFNVEQCLNELETRMNNVTRPWLRESLTRMKDIGMFEERPRNPGEWRAGRLFKSALNMKYVRG
jgi:hypothetical protein